MPVVVKRAGVVALALLLALGWPTSAFAYLKLGFTLNGREVTLKWNAAPIRYFVNNRGTTGLSAADFQSAVARAFATWQAVPTASVAYEFAGFTASNPGDADGRTTLGFLNQPSDDRVLAATSFLVDGQTGELLESDIFFNSIFSWSTAAAGEAGKFDVETIALHEIGHLSGLGHSALGETELSGSGRRVLSSGAVMFPIALGPGDVSWRSLSPDDIAGISDLYPDDQFNDKTGSISGRITKNGNGVFGAHVIAFDPASGERVANFTLDGSGAFAIAGLAPGPHVLRVEPLDDADVESFFEIEDPVDAFFKVKYYENLVIVPRGGDSGAVTVAVESK
jgi:hypothetical protein